MIEKIKKTFSHFAESSLFIASVFLILCFVAGVIDLYQYYRCWRPVHVAYVIDDGQMWILSNSKAIDPIEEPIEIRVDYKYDMGVLRVQRLLSGVEAAFNANIGRADAYLTKHFIIVELLTKWDDNGKAYKILNFPRYEAIAKETIEMDPWMRRDFPNGITNYNWVWTPGEEDPRKGEGHLQVTKYI